MNEITLRLPVSPHELDALAPLVAFAAAEFGAEPAYTGRLRARGERFDAADDVADYLVEQGLVLDEGRDGQLYVACPWRAGHSSDSGITEAAYFPAGTGGFSRGHYRCLHASCAARTDDDFLEAVGCGASADFEALPPIDNQTLGLLPLIDPGLWEDKDVPKREWAWHEWIPARQTTYFTGAGGTGKSWVGQLLATCSALGLPCFGVPMTQAVAIYITCEDGPDELHPREEGMCQALGVPLSALSGKLHLVSLAGAIGNELAVFDVLGRMQTTPAWETLRKTVLATRARFIVLDNVAHLFAGNENIRNQVAAFCGLLNLLAAETGAAVVLISHPNKAGDNFSGSTAWENQVRSRIFLDRPKDEDGLVLDADERRLTRAKANYARTGEQIAFRWHHGAFVRHEDLPEGLADTLAAEGQAAQDNERFLACLAKATTEKRAASLSRAAPNYAPRIFARMPTAHGMTERAMRDAMERLLHLGTIESGVRVYQRDNRAWATGLGLAQSDAQSLHKAAHEARTKLHALTPQSDAHSSSIDTTYLSGAAPEGPDAPDPEARP